jgi:hypothetical protein
MLVKRYGDDAKLEAGKLADELLADGDMDGQRVRLRIIQRGRGVATVGAAGR